MARTRAVWTRSRVSLQGSSPRGLFCEPLCALGSSLGPKRLLLCWRLPALPCLFLLLLREKALLVGAEGLWGSERAGAEGGIPSLGLPHGLPGAVGLFELIYVPGVESPCFAYLPSFPRCQEGAKQQKSVLGLSPLPRSHFLTPMGAPVYLQH